MFRRLRMGIVASVAMVASLMGATPASAATAAPLTPELQNTFISYGLHNKTMAGIVVDSNMTYEQAIGDSVVPPALKARHDQMKPLLRVVEVVHWGYDNRVHIGQIVINEALVCDVNRLFIGMFLQHFPIYSVIPESAFNYVDDNSMAANNSSGYRPDILGANTPSEHFKGAAMDINPFTNPEDMLQDDGTRFIDPPNAHYDPNAQGAIVMEGPVRKLWTSLHWEWGGNWGNPLADPPTDFYKVGYYDYQHFQLDYTRIDTEPLPVGWLSSASVATGNAKPSRSQYALAG